MKILRRSRAVSNVLDTHARTLITVSTIAPLLVDDDVLKNTISIEKIYARAIDRLASVKVLN